MDEAIGHYRKTIELNPETPKTRYYLGRALARQDKLDEAIAEYRRAIELDASNTGSYANLAWILATAVDPALRSPAQAVTLARKATELKPKNSNHWCNLGVAEYSAGNWQDSVDAFRQADVLIGGLGDRQHRFFLAMAHWQLGNQAQANEAFEQAVAWLSENNVNDGEQIRFRDEAESLLKNSTTAKEKSEEDN